MADDKMKNDQRNMGAGQQKDKDYGQQSPGRSGQHEQAGQHAGGQQSGGQFGGQKQGTRNTEDDEDDFGAGQVGTQNRGSQKR
jgi:hypothetical protein